MEIFDQIKDIFGFSLIKTEEINITFGSIIAVVLAFMLTTFVLRFLRKILTRKLPDEDKNKFISIFQFIQYIVYVVVIMFTLKTSGVDISVLLTASAAIFIGLGFALQQLFQDLISGVLIILDQSLHVGDVIEIEGKVCRVEKISLRYTKAITRNDRVMIIPNHKFLSNILFNWTQNGQEVRENITVGVAYGSNTDLVKQLLEKCASNHSAVLKEKPIVALFQDFADSSLNFELFFFVKDSFAVPKTKSDIRFAIDQEFRANNISIPFPQRDIHIITK